MRAALIPLVFASSVTVAADGVEARVEQVRAVYQAVEAEVEAGRLRSTTLTIGGGQNPAEIELHWVGGTEVDFERDPYAEPFALRRVVKRKVLPAVGPASVSFWYDEVGALVFAYAQGVDISGTGLDATPVDELRVYFDGDAAVRVLWDSPQHEPTRRELPVDGAAADALRTQGRALQGALQQLAD